MSCWYPNRDQAKLIQIPIPDGEEGEGEGEREKEKEKEEEEEFKSVESNPESLKDETEKDLDDLEDDEEGEGRPFDAEKVSTSLARGRMRRRTS